MFMSLISCPQIHSELGVTHCPMPAKSDLLEKPLVLWPHPESCGSTPFPSPRWPAESSNPLPDTPIGAFSVWASIPSKAEQRPWPQNSLLRIVALDFILSVAQPVFSRCEPVGKPVCVRCHGLTWLQMFVLSVFGISVGFLCENNSGYRLARLSALLWSQSNVWVSHLWEVQTLSNCPASALSPPAWSSSSVSSYYHFHT